MAIPQEFYQLMLLRDTGSKDHFTVEVASLAPWHRCVPAVLLPSLAEPKRFEGVEDELRATPAPVCDDETEGAAVVRPPRAVARRTNRPAAPPPGVSADVVRKGPIMADDLVSEKNDG